MNSVKNITLILLSLTCAMKAEANEQHSFGVGLGSSYSGLGINIAQLSDDDMKYISAGCVSSSSKNGSTCGLGIGWIVTDLFDNNNNKHGLGAYAGIIGTEINLDDNQPLYGLGFGYHYFLNGINKPGTNLGFSFLTGNSDNGQENVLMFQIGYQF